MSPAKSIGHFNKDNNIAVDPICTVHSCAQQDKYETEIEKAPAEFEKAVEAKVEQLTDI